MECFPCSTEGGVTHPILKNINWPHDTILMRGNTGKGRVREPKPKSGAGAGRGEKAGISGSQPLGFASPKVLGGGGGQSLSL